MKNTIVNHSKTRQINAEFFVWPFRSYSVRNDKNKKAASDQAA